MKKILLVNSTRHFFEEGKSLLDRRDFQVFQTPTAVEALALLQQQHVNLIVSDLELPEMGGDVLCEKLREKTSPHSVAVILVCHNTPEERARASRSSADICLHKPFPASLLLDHVEKLLAVSIRKGYRVLLRAKVQGAQGDAVFFCTSQNISSTGILIEADRPLQSGDRISCSFFLPGSAQITADGEIVRQESAAAGKILYGIRFTTISAEQQQAINHFVDESASGA